MRQHLLQEARVAALGVDMGDIAKLDGSKADLDKHEYLQLKEQLGRIRDAGSHYRFVYLMGLRSAGLGEQPPESIPTGEVFFFADSEAPGSSDFSPPGQVFDEVSEDDLRVFRTGSEAVVGPVEDRWGTWLSALIPISDSRDGRLVAVLGIDVDALDWKRQVFATAAWPTLVTLAALAALGLSFALVQSRRGLLTQQRLVLEGENRLQSLLASIQDMVFTLDLDLVFQDFHQDPSEQLYVAPESFIGKRFDEIGFPEHALQPMREALEYTLQTGEPGTAEYLLETPNGITWHDMRTTALRSSDRRLRGITCVVRDITERTRQQEERLFRIEFQQAAAEAASTLTRVTRDEEFDAAVDHTLRRLGELFGVDRSYLFRFSKDIETMTNTHEWCADGVEPQMDRMQDHPTDSLPWWKQRILEGRPIHLPDIEALPPDAESERREFSSQGIRSLLCLPTLSTHGVLTGFLGFDVVSRPRNWPEEQITMLQLVADTIGGVLERRQVEDALRHKTEELDRYFSSSLDLLCIADSGGRFLRLNPEWEKTLGYSLEELEGRTLLDLVHPDDLEATVEIVSRLADQEQILNFENRYRCKDGSYRWIEWRATPQGDLIYAVARDTTKRRSLEQQLLQTQKMEAIGTLAGGIAHDFNNLLQALLATVQAARVRAGKEAASSLSEVELLVRRGAELARQLLLFARQDQPRRAPMDLAVMLREHTTMLRRLLPANIELRLFAPGEGLVMEGDRAQIEQVITNLVINARDAMPDGGGLDLTGASRKGGITVEVRDTGAGMTEEVRRRIFEPFFSTKPTGKGTGLGLAVAWGIVEQHGGHITVDSTPGAGSTFRIHFPLASPESRELARQDSSGSHPAVGGGQRVLVVEDEEDARKALVDLLEMLGYAVTAVGSAEAAGLLPAEPEFDLLLTDYLLPGAHGLGLAEGLRDRWPDLRVVIMSGYAPDDLARTHSGAAPAVFLQKPFDMDTLARALQVALRGSSGESEAAPPP